MLLLLALLMVAPAVAMAPPAAACADGLLQAGVPCGRIYPIITIESKAGTTPLQPNQSVTLDAVLDFSFKMLGEGYAPVPPTDPITITFEFPRKPAWVDMKVEPDTIPVDVNDPTHMQPDPSNPAGPEIAYDYQVPIKLHLKLVGQAVLRDGYDYAKLLVFAKSSENGLYQSGYGIKEFRVSPAGAIHDSDVAQDRYTTAPLSNFTLRPATGQAAGVKVTLTPPSSGSFWQPQKFTAKIDPAPSGKVVAALHDEWGNLVYATQPLDASSGSVAFTATLARPGFHTATFTLLPDAGSATPPVTVPVSFVAGDVSPQGFSFPKDYVVSDDAVVAAPNGNSADALAQVERDVPVFAFETAQSVTATLTLETPGQALDKGAASLNMQLLDPEGKILQTAAVDPVTYPQRSLRLGSVPEEGWYTIRVKGVGLPQASAWDVKAEVAYATAAVARNRATGLPQATPATLHGGDRNVTLPFGSLQVWAPGDLTPKLDNLSAQYAITVYGPNATLAYASGLRSGKASFSAPAPGTYRAFVYAQPTTPGAPFSPLVRAFTFGVGAGNTTVAQTFAVADQVEIPQSPAAGVVALYGFPAGPAPKVELSASQPGVTLTQAFQEANGTKILVVSAQNPGPATQGSVKASMAFASPQTLVGPLAAQDGGASKGVPLAGAALAVLALAGAAAVVVALARRP